MGRRVVKPEALQSVFVGVRFILSGMYLQSRTRREGSSAIAG